MSGDGAGGGVADMQQRELVLNYKNIAVDRKKLLKTLIIKLLSSADFEVTLSKLYDAVSIYFDVSKKTVARAANELAAEKSIKKTVKAKMTFLRITKVGLKRYAKYFDLIASLRQHETLSQRSDQETDNYTLLILQNSRVRATKEYYDTAFKILTKDVCNLSAADREFLQLNFFTYCDNARNKVIALQEKETKELEFIEYKTRFTNKQYARAIIAKFNRALIKAYKRNNSAVFLTLTLPTIFNLQIQKYAINFLFHRIKAFLRKKYKRNIEHIAVDEPQKSLAHHKHCLLFCDYIMHKKELTIYLDQHLTSFLNSLGNHVQKTLNNRLSEEDREKLNEYGKILLKKYLRYKKKKKRYTGPVNFITKVRFTNSTFEFVNLPPDLIPSKSKTSSTLTDGAGITVNDYLRKYMIKNISKIEDENNDDITLAWYWITRCRFFTCSPSLRPPPRRGGRRREWKFVGAYNKNDLERLEILA